MANEFPQQVVDTGTATVSGTVVEAPVPDQDLGALGKEVTSNDLFSSPQFLQKLGISPVGYIDLIKTRTQREQGENSANEDFFKRIVSGEELAQVEANLAETRAKAEKLIDDIANAFVPNVDKSYLESDLEAEFQERMSISDIELAKKTNPLTGKPYTRDEWVSGMKTWRKDEAVRRGLKVDPYEAAGAAFAQLIGLATGQGDVVVSSATAAEEERLRRLEMQQAATVRKLEAGFAAKNAQLKYVLSQVDNGMDLYRMAKQNQAAAANSLWENEQQNKRLKTQIDAGQFELATREAGDILGNLRLLPSDQVKSAAQRYNTMATYANSVSDKGEVLKVLTDQEVLNLEREASYRETQKLKADFNDFVYKFRGNWENVTEVDKQAMLKQLQSEGPKWVRNADGDWVQRLLTLDDVAVVAEGFNRLTPTTQLSKDKLDELKRQFDKKLEFEGQQAQLDRLNDLKIADIRKSAAIAVAQERTRAASMKLFQGSGLSNLELEGLEGAFKDAVGNIADLDSSISEWVGHLKKGTYSGVINPATNQAYTAAQAEDLIETLIGVRNGVAKNTRQLFGDYDTVLGAQFDLGLEQAKKQFANDPRMLELLNSKQYNPQQLSADRLFDMGWDPKTKTIIPPKNPGEQVKPLTPGTGGTTIVPEIKK